MTEEKKVQIPSLWASERCSQTPQGRSASRSFTFAFLFRVHVHVRVPGEKRTRRRRKKAKGDAKKRRLSEEQVKLLEMSFRDERKLEAGRKAHLAAKLGLDANQVAVWFQNRRARHKSKQVKEAYVELKLAHDAVVVDKCRLENEVSKLKEKLSEAEEEVRKLASGMNGASGGNAESGGGGSPSSCFSAASLQWQQEEAELMCINEYDFTNYMMMEWADLYGV
ncbi:hypothetical protein BHE74_00004452 [Ensete ventricosum]|nr:hypothetical protein GW17_00032659 [Ensete ventricosum]RWW86762.1 hypothetical protein BHE74_00004452 [Ensete ventricosum]